MNNLTNTNIALPDNCIIRLLSSSVPGDNCKSFTLEFVDFSGERPTYRSGIYYARGGEADVKRKAIEVCRMHGWYDKPPGDDPSLDRLRELEEMVEDMITELDQNPQRFTGTAKECWEEMFNWSDGSLDSDTSDVCEPTPTRDSDRAGGWSLDNYTMRMRRIIPLNVAGQPAITGVRGIEIVTFSQGDMDGNWDDDAQFDRRQFGAKQTKDDETAYEVLVALKEKAGDKYYRHHHPYVHMAEDAEYFDGDEFLTYAIQGFAYWSILRHQLYNVECVITGKDPLNQVTPEFRGLRTEGRVTVDDSGTVSAMLTDGDAEGLPHLVKFCEGYSVADLRKIISDNPAGKAMDTGSLASQNYGWKPAEVRDRTVILQVAVEMTEPVPMTPERVRAVMGKQIEESTVTLIAEINERYPVKK